MELLVAVEHEVMAVPDMAERGGWVNEEYRAVTWWLQSLSAAGDHSQVPGLNVQIRCGPQEQLPARLSPSSLLSDIVSLSPP